MAPLDRHTNLLKDNKKWKGLIENSGKRIGQVVWSSHTGDRDTSSSRALSPPAQREKRLSPRGLPPFSGSITSRKDRRGHSSIPKVRRGQKPEREKARTGDSSIPPRTEGIRESMNSGLACRMPKVSSASPHPEPAHGCGNEPTGRPGSPREPNGENLKNAKPDPFRGPALRWGKWSSRIPASGWNRDARIENHRTSAGGKKMGTLML